MDIPLKLCAKKNMNGVPDSEVTQLTQPLANTCSEQKNNVVNTQTTEDFEDAKVVA